MEDQHSLQAKLAAGSRLADRFDVIVVGAGHAGIEAAMAAVHMGYRTAIFTLHIDALANMPCNPNIGGTAKGQLVREIDALGGVMGLVADRNTIQFRMLNRSKGPAVLSPRAQQDRWRYQRDMRDLLLRQDNLFVIQSEVTELLWREVGDQRVVEGVMNKLGSVYAARRVILATGTFLNAQVIIGEAVYASGPDGLLPAHGLSQSLQALGFTLKRFKTGTPGRFHARSLRYAACEEQPADAEAWPFSFSNENNKDWHPLAGLACYLTHSTAASQKLIQDNLIRSPLYSGVIKGVGPRYCPSFEDKIVKFPDRDRHHVFLEPCGLDSVEVYASGLSTSMPEDVQRELVKTVPGMEQAEIIRFAYAIEYDLLDSQDLQLNLEARTVSGLYAAGQINGSSGYEEAAAQGLVAGINACLSLAGKPPLILDRSQAYIGVLIDDLVSKGTNEPYRMMTSRAEYRLLLRQDNADRRLTPIGHELGLISEERWQAFQEKQARIETEIERLTRTRVSPDERLRAFLDQQHSSLPAGGISLRDLLTRPEITYAALAAVDLDRPPLAYPHELAEGQAFLTPVEAFTVEVDIKYAGYIKMEEERVRQFHKLEKRKIPPDFPYEEVRGLKREAQQKLQAMRPASIGQAGRLPGVTPADVSVLLVALSQWEKKGSPQGA